MLILILLLLLLILVPKCTRETISERHLFMILSTEMLILFSLNLLDLHLLLSEGVFPSCIRYFSIDYAINANDEEAHAEDQNAHV